MFTPKRSSPIMLKMTLSTQAHRNPVSCSLPRKESLLLQACGKQQVECDVTAVNPSRPFAP